MFLLYLSANYNSITFLFSYKVLFRFYVYSHIEGFREIQGKKISASLWIGDWNPQSGVWWVRWGARICKKTTFEIKKGNILCFNKNMISTGILYLIPLSLGRTQIVEVKGIEKISYRLRKSNKEEGLCRRVYKNFVLQMLRQLFRLPYNIRIDVMWQMAVHFFKIFICAWFLIVVRCHKIHK